MYDVSVIIPTFKERDNIVELLRAINNTLSYYNINGEIIVVDDNSPDGTAKFAETVAKTNPNIRVIVRTEDKGLSQSVVEGFRQAQSDIFIVMDSDFSHPIACVSKFYKKIKEGYDIVIGSRYMKDGEIKGWGAKRKVISSGATFLARVMFPNITDPVSGLFAIHRDVIKDAPLRPSGYKILTEILGKGTYHNVAEIPYKFVNRKKGSSKLGFSQIFEYAVQVLDLVAHAATHRNNIVWHEIVCATKFAVVGTSGVVINLGMLYAIVEGLGLNYMVAGVLAIEASILSNFYFNDRWTFHDVKTKPLKQRIYLFHLVSVGGMIINLAVLFTLTTLGLWYIQAQFIGILIAFTWNFVVNRRKTWGN